MKILGQICKFFGSSMFILPSLGPENTYCMLLILSDFSIGRSGRFGRKGVAINFVTEGDKLLVKDIETFYNTHIEEMPMNIVDLL